MAEARLATDRGGQAGPIPRVAPHAGLAVDLVSARFRSRIPRDFAREHLVVSQGQDEEGRERLAIAESTPPHVVWNTRVRLAVPVETFIADAEAIAQTIDASYGRAPDEQADTGDQLTPDDLDGLIRRADKDLLTAQGKGPVVKLVDALLFDALSRGASDVHVQPLDDRTLVRYRLDGLLTTARELPPRATAPVISRIKVMGRMDIAETRIPQDGRATVTIGSRPIDLRISTLPTSYGERAVLRLLDNRQQLCDFPRLGMPGDVAERFLACARRSNGIVLLTGPTGSGKTTTLYATLREIGSAAQNLMTIEDPIEYELSTVGLAISQAQVNPKKGVTFATGLRHILRQDPDVVMVGEIRDLETARIALQASLTGHLVFSTLHTNDATSAVTRLVDLGLEPYLVAASLSAVCAQRLVRLTHTDCEGVGCETCFGSGFKGRQGLFELLVIDERLQALIARGAPLSDLREAARAAGLETLHQQGLRLVAERKTTRAEIERVVQGASP